MPKFLAVYTGTPAATPPDPETMMRGGRAWGEWMQKNASHVVEGGGPLGRTKRVSKAGVADARNNLSAFTIIEAESQEAAAALFENHPHFAIFPGDGVDIMPILPIPSF